MLKKNSIKNIIENLNSVLKDIDTETNSCNIYNHVSYKKSPKVKQAKNRKRKKE